MHEMAIAQGIMNIAVTAARENGAGKIAGVTVQIGQMTGIDPESLVFCFNSLAKAQDSVDAAEAVLTVKTAPLRAQCQDCRQDIEFPAPAGGALSGVRGGMYRFFCPQCNSPQINIISGRELKVEHVDVE